MNKTIETKSSTPLTRTRRYLLLLPLHHLPFHYYVTMNTQQCSQTIIHEACLACHCSQASLLVIACNSPPRHCLQQSSSSSLPSAVRWISSTVALTSDPTWCGDKTAINSQGRIRPGERFSRSDPTSFWPLDNTAS